MTPCRRSRSRNCSSSACNCVHARRVPARRAPRLLRTRALPRLALLPRQHQLPLTIPQPQPRPRTTTIRPTPHTHIRTQHLTPQPTTRIRLYPNITIRSQTIPHQLPTTPIKPKILRHTKHLRIKHHIPLHILLARGTGNKLHHQVGIPTVLVPHHPTVARLGSVHTLHKEKVGTLEARLAFWGFGFHILLDLFGLLEAVVDEHIAAAEVVVGFAEVVADEFVEE
jgi:hypothetical protein